MQAVLHLFDEEPRKASFKTWIFKSDQPCSAEKLAEAGFIYTGTSKEPDSVQCFFCSKSLDGWEAADEPWLEHLQHAPHCDFAKKQKAQDYWTLDEWLEVLEEYQKILVRNECAEEKKRLKKHHETAKKLMADL